MDLGRKERVAIAAASSQGFALPSMERAVWRAVMPRWALQRPSPAIAVTGVDGGGSVPR